MPEKGDQEDQDKLNEKHKALLDRIQEVLTSRVTSVNVSRRLVDSPACVVASDHDLNPQVRRMLEASGQAVPESKPILEINVKHPLVTRLSEETDAGRFGALSEIVLDHALLAEGSSLPNPAEYVRRMNDYLLNAEPRSRQ
jgi:molecular chaperone HtpG